MEREETVEQNNEPLFIKEAVVKRLLNWNEAVDAIESALVAATNNTRTADRSYSNQTARMVTSIPEKGIMFTMPGFLGNYPLKSITGEMKHSTLACKLVTAFGGNTQRKPPLPTILATILLIDSSTGQLKAVIEGTEITAWRTATVSLVATKHLFYKGRESSTDNTLAICGTGTQVI